jgi:hypothetical protein
LSATSGRRTTKKPAGYDAQILSPVPARRGNGRDQHNQNQIPAAVLRCFILQQVAQASAVYRFIAYAEK